MTCLTHSPLPPQVPQRLGFLLGGMGGSEDVETAAAAEILLSRRSAPGSRFEAPFWRRIFGSLLDRMPLFLGLRPRFFVHALRPGCAARDGLGAGRF